MRSLRTAQGLPDVQKSFHKTSAAAAGPEARWRRREFSAESTDASANSLLALGLRCSASLADLL